MKVQLSLVAIAALLGSVHAFAPPVPVTQHGLAAGNRVQVALTAKAGGPKKKKRRRRKEPPTESKVMEATGPAVEPTIGVADTEKPTQEDLSVLADVASFKFESDDAITLGIQDDEQPEQQGQNDVLVLPDIKDQLKKKQMEQELALMEEEKKTNIKKIKRSDTAAFTKLLESQPFADADDSFFEEEEYGTVSALLGERSKPFLGIPSGFLQVGHFIGALGIVLMAFVQYPGFPLTNLPTPLRESFQGGLATIYAINAVLAVISTFKAGERGQSKTLWAIKTFSVGGLALDQLTQLPTLEQVEQAKSVKGKRALSKKK